MKRNNNISALRQQLQQNLNEIQVRFIVSYRYAGSGVDILL